MNKIEYMKQVVIDYIYHRKNEKVEISITNHFDLMQLTSAYNYAVNWFNKNNMR